MASGQNRKIHFQSISGKKRPKEKGVGGVLNLLVLDLSLSESNITDAGLGLCVCVCDTVGRVPVCVSTSN